MTEEPRIGFYRSDDRLPGVGLLRVTANEGRWIGGVWATALGHGVRIMRRWWWEPRWSCTRKADA